MDDPTKQPALSDGSRLFVPRRFQRPKVLKWLRRTHGWIGLWGAVLGLLFGISGVVQNHREVLKVPAAQWKPSTVTLPLPAPPPASAKELAAWLGTELKLQKHLAEVRAEPARTVAWQDRALRQPERWAVSFGSPSYSVHAEHWVGTGHVVVRRNDGNFLAMLTRLHKGEGMGQGRLAIAWVLLADTIAGGLVMLALTGVFLWTRLHGPRLLALGLIGTALTLLIAIVATALY